MGKAEKNNLQVIWAARLAPGRLGVCLDEIGETRPQECRHFARNVQNYKHPGVDRR